MRKIPKEAIYSTTDQETSSPQGLEESAKDSEHVYYSINEIPIDPNDKYLSNIQGTDHNEDNIYESVEMQNNPESGFFSMDHGKTKSKKITCIPVNQRPSSSSSDDYVSCHVTVNGKLWINPLSNILDDDDPNDILDDPNDILDDSNDILDDPNAYFVQTTNSSPVLTNGDIKKKLLLSVFIFLFLY